MEVDGPQHADRAEDDRARTAVLERHGFRVLRVWNDEVFADIRGVLEAIAAAVGIPSP